MKMNAVIPHLTQPHVNRVNEMKMIRNKYETVDTCLENAESELFSILLRHDSRRSAEFRARLLSELLTAVPLLLAVPLGTYRSTGR